MKKILLTIGLLGALFSAYTSQKEEKKEMKDLSFITIEEHFTAQEIMDANNSYAPKRELTEEEKEIMNFYSSRMFLTNDLIDTEKQRFAHMDSNNIQMQILSYTSPIRDYVPKKEAVKLCKRANDILFESVQKHPDRYKAFATLPMASPEEAAKELERCVKDLGFVGALLAGQYKGRWYEEKEFWPIFAKAAELNVPVYFHPDLIDSEVQQKVYMSSAYSPIVGAELASAGLGWHLNVGIQAIRLILSGIFDKYPNLQIISGHWGESLPIFLDRMDEQLNPEMTGLKHKISYYYKNNIYLTPSGIMSEVSLEAMVKIMGAERIIYAEDYPYKKPANFKTFLQNSNLSDKDKELIANGNAKRLFKIK